MESQILCRSFVDLSKRPDGEPDDGKWTVKGFKAAGVTAGLKPSGKPDVGLITSEKGCVAAGLFTKNAFAAAPVIVDRDLLNTDIPIQAIVIHAGQANACTGKAGLQDARETISYTNAKLSLDPKISTSLVMSTGVIGRRVNLEKLKVGVDKACSDLSVDGWARLSRAVMTTDTVPKRSFIRYSSPNGASISIGGFCKGSGMIHPNMGTMLSAIVTDAKITKQCLQSALSYSVDRTINCVDVDGDTSTNDSIIALANGLSDSGLIDKIDSKEYLAFRDNLELVLRGLAKQLAADGEGATKLATVVCHSAPDQASAMKVCQAISQSSLFKCALFGQDPNWGRVICAVGYSGVKINPNTVSLAFSEGDETSSQNRVVIVENGEPVGGEERRKEAGKVMKSYKIRIDVDLGMGSEEATVWFCDFSRDYVTINSDYTT